MDVVGLVQAILLAAALLLAIPVVWLIARRRWLSRQGGTFECSVRLTTTTPGTGWVLGVARYRADSLEWFNSFSLSLRPRMVLPRGDTRSGGQRGPTPVEAVLLFDNQRIVELISGSGAVWEFSMAPESLTGLLSWLESSPPGMSYRGRPR